MRPQARPTQSQQKALVNLMEIWIIHLVCLTLKMNPPNNRLFWKKPPPFYLKRPASGNQRYAPSFANTGFADFHVRTVKKIKVVDLPMENMNCSQSKDLTKNTLRLYARTSWNTLQNVLTVIDVSSNIPRWTPVRNSQLRQSSGRTLSTPRWDCFKIFLMQRLCTLMHMRCKHLAFQFSNKLPPTEARTKDRAVTESCCTVKPNLNLTELFILKLTCEINEYGANAFYLT